MNKTTSMKSDYYVKALKKAMKSEKAAIKSYVKSGDMDSYIGMQKVAKRLGMSQRTLYRKLHYYSIHLIRSRKSTKRTSKKSK